MGGWGGGQFCLEELSCEKYCAEFWDIFPAFLSIGTCVFPPLLMKVEFSLVILFFPSALRAVVQVLIYLPWTLVSKFLPFEWTADEHKSIVDVYIRGGMAAALLGLPFAN